MPEVPLIVNGVSRLVWVDPLTEDTWNATQHQYRRLGVMLRRSYYEGNQYDQDNLEKKKELFPSRQPAELALLRLPEHRRKHAYASAIEEGINFLADSMTNGMVWMGSNVEFCDAVSGECGLEHRASELVREVLIAGDLFVHYKSLPVRSVTDPDLPAVKVEFWEAEDVEADYDPDDWEKLVEVRYEEWRSEPDIEGRLQDVRYVHVFSMEPFVGPDGFVGEEAVETIYRGDDSEPWAVRRLELPFIPWGHISGEQESLRSKYGKPLITGALMEAADRFAAVSQLEFLAVRYNSFGNLAVAGDAANLKLENATHIPKDIADVLGFPGGTTFHDISLDINVEAFQDAKDQLKDEMYDRLGLTRIDDDSVNAIGSTSGYALEILNRKTDGTFRRIVNNMRAGFIAVMHKAMDVDTYSRVDSFVTDDNGEQVRAWWLGDPEQVFPDRDDDLMFGSAYIVDDVAVRDDFIAGLISLEEALRQKGYDEEEITKIKQEMADDADAKEQRMIATIQQGSRFSTDRA